jgi:type IV pilus assembly protein PilQ
MWIRTRVVTLATGAMLWAVTALTFAADPQTISEVEVQQQDGVTRIVLRGAQDPIYTAFMREDPPRLIVELPDVTFEGISTPIQVTNGVVREVAFGTFGEPGAALRMARISVALEQEAEYELLPQGETLAIELRPVAGAQAPQHSQSENAAASEAPVPAASDPAPSLEVAEVEPQPLPASEPAATRATPESVLPEPRAAQPRPHSQIQRLELAEGGLRVFANGPIDNADAFTLEDPDRLVIDFWGAESLAKPERVEAWEGAVSRVRVGQHTDKVRVVLDLRGPLAEHRLEPFEGGVWIALTPGTPQASAEHASIPAAPEASPADAVPAEPEPSESAGSAEPHTPASPAPAPTEPAATPWPAAADEMVEKSAFAASEPPALGTEPALAPTTPVPPTSNAQRVESVHFESLDTMDRVVVALDAPGQAELVEPDPQTAIVMLKGVEIAPDVERRVDTQEFHGAVDFFSVFRTPDIEGREVRVVLKRNAPIQPALRWEGGRLLVEVPRPHGERTSPAAPAAGTPGLAAATPSRVPTAPAALSPDDDFEFGGPAQPASIDLLEEGGFNEEKSYTGRRISLDFKDADIGNILRLIAEVSDLNVIAGEEVSGKVTIRLVDVPWDQALDVILLTKGLGFIRVGNVLRIAPLETLKLESEARLQERRSKEKLEDLIVKLQPVNYADVKEVKDLVSRLLSPRGTVNMDNRTNTLIIKDIPSVIHEATALVKAVDTQTPQVLVEAKIVEANLSFARSLGAIWAAGYRPLGTRGGAEDFRFSDGTNASQINNSPDGNQLTNFIASNPASGALTGLLNLGILSLDDHLQLDLQLQAAEDTNKGKVISSPRVVTLDNREATIKQGVAVKFEATTEDKITVSFIDAVLELKVTPHITANRSIIMKVKVSRNAPQLSQSGEEIVGIAKNETETEALIRDGETMVLGGIYVVDSGRIKTKVPYLADIPLLGAVFRSNTLQDERRELLIFVTPRVVLGPASDAA